MKVTMSFPTKAKKSILTNRGNLRPEIVKDLSLMIDGYYKSVGSSYKSLLENPNIPLTIEIVDNV